MSAGASEKGRPKPPPLSPEQLARLRRLIAVAIIVPVIVAIGFVIAEAGPARWVIDYVVDERGRYSLRAVVGGTIVVVLGIELALLIPVGIVAAVIRKRRARRG